MPQKTKKKIDRPAFRRLMTYFRPYIFWIIIAIGCAAIVSASNGAVAYLIKPAMENIFSGEPLGSIRSMVLKNEQVINFLGKPPPKLETKETQEVSPEKNANQVEKDWERRVFYRSIIPIVLIILFLNKGIFRFWQNYILRIIGEKVIKLVRLQLYEKYQGLSIDYYSKSNTGVMMSRITNDVNMIQRAVPSMVRLFQEPLTMICLSIVAFSQIWYLAIIIFVIFPITAVPIVKFGKLIQKYTKRGQEHMGDLNTVLKENFSGIRVIKAFGMEDYEIKRFQTENELLYKTTKKRIVFDELSSPVVELIAAFAGAVVIYFGSWLVLKTSAFGGHYIDAFGGITLTLTSGQFFAFIASLLMMYDPLKKINKMNVNFQSAIAAAVRVFEVFDQSTTVVEREKPIRLPRIQKEVRFRNVRFRYQSDWVLNGIDFTAKAGQSIAFVGSSGAGKTTLVNLIPRFYDVSQGAIEIDGVDIKDVTLDSLRSQIGMVTQETFLFADTVQSNIAYGHDTPNREKMIQTAKAAFAHEFIVEMSEQYNTLIGELGVKLSGGQRQRLAISRALFKNAPILILDEATSALDTESEQKVQFALENLMRGRTTFVIAHRLSTIRNADRILVLKNGRIVEDGNHDQLLAKGGEYARLYNIQFTENGS